MNIVIFLIAGGVIGWIASLVMRTDAQQGILLNIIVGIAGTALGGFLIGPMFGTPALNQSGSVSLASAAVSLAGALILLAVWNVIRRGRVR
jgi:uncharacterized membrane protein YeaQ/YmgE (transglycosylase-associated protein family)